MRASRAIAQYEATVVLVVISLSLASVVYTAVKREAGVSSQPIFVSAVTAIGGTPTIDRVVVNSSSPAGISSISLDSASSSSGVLEFNGSGYSTVDSLCAAGGTTFFSVLASQAGTLQVSTNGASWVSGAWTSSESVSAGWQEVMIQGGSSCSVTLPGGGAAPAMWTASSGLLSSLPLMGSHSGTSFTFYVPTAGGPQAILLASTGGLDDIEV